MKSETRMSAKILDDGRVNVDIQGPANEVLSLLEEETVSVFKKLEEEGYPAMMAAFYLFVKNVGKEVFGFDF